VENAAVASQVRINKSSENETVFKDYKTCLGTAFRKQHRSSRPFVQQYARPMEPQLRFPELRTRFHRKT